MRLSTTGLNRLNRLNHFSDPTPWALRVSSFNFLTHLGSWSIYLGPTKKHHQPAKMIGYIIILPITPSKHTKHVWKSFLECISYNTISILSIISWTPTISLLEIRGSQEDDWGSACPASSVRCWGGAPEPLLELSRGKSSQDKAPLDRTDIYIYKLVYMAIQI